MSSQATIIDRTRIGNTVPSEEDFALAITTTDLSRTINIGSNWQRIRVGLRAQISSSSANNNIISQPQLAIGLCANTGSTYSIPTGQHFVGVDLDPQFFLINNVGTANDNYVTSGDSANVGLTRRFCTKINGTRTVYGSAFVDSIGAYRRSGSVQRTLAFVDFIKQTNTGSVVDPGNWTVRYSYGVNGQSADGGGTNYDISASIFYSQLANDTASTAYVPSLTQQSVPVSESINGSLTTVNIYWSKNTPPYEISDVAVWRFA